MVLPLFLTASVLKFARSNNKFSISGFNSYAIIGGFYQDEIAQINVPSGSIYNVPCKLCNNGTYVKKGKGTSPKNVKFVQKEPTKLYLPAFEPVTVRKVMHEQIGMDLVKFVPKRD